MTEEPLAAATRYISSLSSAVCTSSKLKSNATSHLFATCVQPTQIQHNYFNKQQTRRQYKSKVWWRFPLSHKTSRTINQVERDNDSVSILSTVTNLIVLRINNTAKTTFTRRTQRKIWMLCHRRNPGAMVRQNFQHVLSLCALTLIR